MDAMQDMSDNSKLLADMFKGNIEIDRGALINAADTFALHATKMAELFPNTEESRTGNKTEALPSIWEDWDDFSKRVTKFIELSESFKDTVASTEDVDTLKQSFTKTVKSCSGCHKRFRKPKG